MGKRKSRTGIRQHRPRCPGGVVQDITAQKVAEDELRLAKIEFRTIADFTYDWEWWSNLDGTFRYNSPACERITGYKADRFMEDPALLRKIIVPEDRETWDKHYHEASVKLERQEVQFRIKRRDGKVRWIEHACQPVYTGHNEFDGFRASNLWSGMSGVWAGNHAGI
jgi:formate hydrogenlyase transcriptional activator